MEEVEGGKVGFEREEKGSWGWGGKGGGEREKRDNKIWWHTY